VALGSGLRSDPTSPVFITLRGFNFEGQVKSGGEDEDEQEAGRITVKELGPASPTQPI
jgi:hypothetical protein